MIEASLTGGKQLRARALLSCAEKYGKIPAAAAYFAAAAELLHLATLVHDDVIDDASTRRGAVSLQEKYGKRRAVICGDYLLCKALSTAAKASKTEENDLAAELVSAASRLCLGELLQQENSGNFSLTLRGYLKIIRGKTAALFEACFFAGAVIAKSAETARYRRLGRYVGMLFQLCDDCADYEQSTAAVGKPTRSDYEQGVVTLPLIIAAKREPKIKLKGLPFAEILKKVTESGGLDTTHALAGRYYKKALFILDRLDITAEKRAGIHEIIEKCGGGGLLNETLFEVR